VNYPTAVIMHGDPYTLIALAPGASFARDPRLDRPFEPTHIVGYSMDGTRANRSDLTIDGVPSTATANAFEVIASYVPPADAISEFKIQTATYSAEFGRAGGGVIRVLVAASSGVIRAGLESLVRASPSLELAGSEVEAVHAGDEGDDARVELVVALRSSVPLTKAPKPPAEKGPKP